ncbi:MAG: DUF4139 domain-containing protein [Nitrospirae bacterium]|nr:DUF4139 domain-containing protein [Nitrospirota bacterium]
MALGLLVFGSFEISAGKTLTAAPALESALSDQESVAVTIYNNGLGLVREVRKIPVPRGVGELRFMDVAAQIRPETVHIQPLDGDLAVLEQNYEYDLLSPAKLLEKQLGKEVELARYDKDAREVEVRKATLLSTNQGFVYRMGDRIVINPPGEVRLTRVPDDLIAKPTLVWLLKGSGGTQRVETSYLTRGLTWQADYVLVLDKGDKHAGVNGWVTLDNTSGAAYRNARLQLVAGDVQKVEEDYRVGRDLLAAKAARAETPAFKEQAFFEYHLYTLERPATIKQNQKKQVQLLEAESVPVRKDLVYRGDSWLYRNKIGHVVSDQKVGVFLTFENRKDHGMGMPIPKGIVRVYKADASGAQQFVGEDRIDHTPRDEKVRIKMGNAFDVVAERRQTDFEVISDNVREVAFEVKIRNHKEEDVVVRVVEPMAFDWRVLQASHPYEKIDARTLEFKLPVAKGKEAKLAYRVRVKF